MRTDFPPDQPALIGEEFQPLPASFAPLDSSSGEKDPGWFGSLKRKRSFKGRDSVKRTGSLKRKNSLKDRDVVKRKDSIKDKDSVFKRKDTKKIANKE